MGGFLIPDERIDAKRGEQTDFGIGRDSRDYGSRARSIRSVVSLDC